MTKYIINIWDTENHIRYTYSTYEDLEYAQRDFNIIVTSYEKRFKISLSEVTENVLTESFGEY